VTRFEIAESVSLVPATLRVSSLVNLLSNLIPASEIAVRAKFKSFNSVNPRIDPNPASVISHPVQLSGHMARHHGVRLLASNFRRHLFVSVFPQESQSVRYLNAHALI